MMNLQKRCARKNETKHISFDIYTNFFIEREVGNYIFIPQLSHNGDVTIPTNSYVTKKKNENLKLKRKKFPVIRFTWAYKSWASPLICRAHPWPNLGIKC